MVFLCNVRSICRICLESVFLFAGDMDVISCMLVLNFVRTHTSVLVMCGSVSVVRVLFLIFLNSNSLLVDVFLGFIQAPVKGYTDRERETGVTKSGWGISQDINSSSQDPCRRNCVWERGLNLSRCPLVTGEIRTVMSVFMVCTWLGVRWVRRWECSGVKIAGFPVYYFSYCTCIIHHPIKYIPKISPSRCSK